MSREELGRFQRALAALLYEPEEREAHAKDFEAWLAARELAPKMRAILASVPRARIDRFHEMQLHERGRNLRALFPLALARAADPRALDGYFAAHHYGYDDARLEADRFARWACATLDAAPADLAEYEAALVALRAQMPREPDPSARVVVRSPGARVLAVSTNVAEMVDDPGAPSRAAAAWILLVRRADGIRSGTISAAVAETLLSCASPKPAAQVDRVDELLAEGALVSADGDQERRASSSTRSTRI